MPPPDELSDDFVAAQLAKDAKDSQLKYSSIGIDAFLPQKRASPALKPNTRFLKAIIKETDSHNAALRKVDACRNLPGASKDKSTSHSTDKQSKQSRHRLSAREGRGDDRTRKRSREHRRHHRRKHSDADSSDSGKKEGQRSKREVFTPSHRHRHRLSRSASPPTDNTSRNAPHRLSRSRSRSRSPSRRSRDAKEHLRTDREHSKRHSHHRGDRKRNDRSRSPHGRRDRDRDRDRHRHRNGQPSRRERSREHTERHRHERRSSRHDRSREPAGADYPQEGDSDPLADIVGEPLPKKQPVPRGRGANRTQPNIDSHFNPGYDPTTDVQPDSADDDDWGQALEALRDRQRWKQMGASRLKDAGFSEREIHKWERGGEEHEGDIRWKRSGEGREWDRGKVVTAEGQVETAPGWPR